MTIISALDHARVLAECIDVPEQKPSFAIPLSRVGISGKTVWVRLPEGNIPFAATMEVDLAAESRGIHMSRMEEVIASLYEREFTDLQEYGVALAEEMTRRQGAKQGRVVLDGQLPLVRRATASGRRSLDSIRVSVAVDIVMQEDMKQTVLIGAAVNHITACPCTQAYNQVLFDKSPDENCPLPTHSQRSTTSLRMETRKGFPAFSDLVRCLEEALHVTQDLLKRPDEADLVLKSHSAPQFAEDAVRQTARMVGLRFGADLPPQTRVEIESLSLESIHIHDVCCRLETKLAEITALL